MLKCVAFEIMLSAAAVVSDNGPCTDEHFSPVRSIETTK